jgi:hypothetical protein
VAQGDQSVIILVAFVYLWVTTYRLYLLGFLRTELMVLFGLLAFALSAAGIRRVFRLAWVQKNQRTGVHRKRDKCAAVVAPETALHLCREICSTVPESYHAVAGVTVENRRLHVLTQNTGFERNRDFSIFRSPQCSHSGRRRPKRIHDQEFDYRSGTRQCHRPRTAFRTIPGRKLS